MQVKKKHFRHYEHFINTAFIFSHEHLFVATSNGKHTRLTFIKFSHLSVNFDANQAYLIIAENIGALN